MLRRDFLKFLGLAAATVALPKISRTQTPPPIEAPPVVPKIRKLKATWTPELAQDLRAYHGIDAERELTEMLSEELSREIDKELLGTIHAKTVMDKKSFCIQKELTFVEDGKNSYKNMWGLKVA